MITEKRKKRLAEMLSMMRDEKISREVKDKVMDVYFKESDSRRPVPKGIDFQLGGLGSVLYASEMGGR